MSTYYVPGLGAGPRAADKADKIPDLPAPAIWLAAGIRQTIKDKRTNSRRSQGVSTEGQQAGGGASGKEEHHESQELQERRGSQEQTQKGTQGAPSVQATDDPF